MFLFLEVLSLNLTYEDGSRKSHEIFGLLLSKGIAKQK